MRIDMVFVERHTRSIRCAHFLAYPPQCTSLPAAKKILLRNQHIFSNAT